MMAVAGVGEIRRRRVRVPVGDASEGGMMVWAKYAAEFVYPRGEMMAAAGVGEMRYRRIRVPAGRCRQRVRQRLWAKYVAAVFV